MCPRFPYPLEKGDKLRMYHQLRWLSKSNEILLIALTDEEVSPENRTKVEEVVTELKVYKLKKIKQISSLVKSVFNELPFQVSYYYDPVIAKEIKGEVDRFSPDHIYCQLTRMSEYCKGISVPKTLDYMDAFGIGMSRRAEVVSGLMSYVYRHEASRMKRYEDDIYKYFDHHTIISEQDANCLSHPVDVVPNGIDVDYFQPRTTQKVYDIGFVGNMGYAPNIDGAEYLINKIKPNLIEGLSYVLAGARPNKRVKQLASDGVVVTGWMDDVRDAYAQTKVFVAPLLLGTGQQNKILEAMAMGIPCVTSTSVNNAIGAEPGKEILVAEDEHEFAECIKKLLNDDLLYEQMRNNALTFVANKYSWESNVNKLKSVFNSK